MNFSDLFVVLALVSALYALIVAMTRQRHFLARAVNPHRTTWLVVALGILWVGVSLLRWEAESWAFSAWGPLLRQLVTDAPTPPRVKVASMALFLGVIFLGLVTWCSLFLPRDPSTFHRPEDRKVAFRYYVGRLRGGLDYAMLSCGDGEVLEESTNLRQVNLRASHLPKVQSAPSAAPTIRTVDQQVDAWRRMAIQLHRRMAELDELIVPANQGCNRRIVFDAEYGGIFFKYLRLPDPRSKVDTALFLFGATLNQVAMDSQTAELHYRLLLQALQNIDRSIRVD